jgi:hypothetical protein
MECRDIEISCIAAKTLAEPLEACRPQEGLKAKAPKHRRYLAGPLGETPQGGFHSRCKILGVQSRLARLQKHTDLGRSRIRGAQLGWQGRSHTKILQDLGIKARRPQAGHFGVQATNIAVSHLAEP